MSWLAEGEEVEYEQKKTFYFAPDLSVGGEDDRVIIPNVPMLVSLFIRENASN